MFDPRRQGGLAAGTGNLAADAGPTPPDTDDGRPSPGSEPIATATTAE